MKAKALQFGKAMGAALFVLLLVVAGTKNALAQTTYIATLQHGESISTFYGQNAFSEAYGAAISGDIITLSSGTYNFTNYSDYSNTITKAITIRGAGCAQDSVSGVSPTVIGGATLNIPESEGILSIEGIHFSQLFCTNLYGLKICKCCIDAIQCIDYGDGVVIQNAQIINCFIGNYYCSNSAEVQVQFINCVINGINSYPSLAGVGISNSILNGVSLNGGMALVQNSILMNVNASPTSIIQNCIGIFGNAFEGQQNSTNWQTWEYSDVFETFNGEWYSYEDLLNEQFILKNEVATSFLGTDGTEVGIHGGAAPYKLRPNYMVLKRCNVANQSTIDNKLSVEIEVVAEGE